MWSTGNIVLIVWVLTGALFAAAGHAQEITMTVHGSRPTDPSASVTIRNPHLTMPGEVSVPSKKT